MSKKQLILAAVTAAVLVALVLGFAFFMAGRERIWSEENQSLPALIQLALVAGRSIRRYAFLVVFLLVVGSFGTVWLAGLLFGKKDNL